MATFSQLPGTLDVYFIPLDEVAISLDFDRDVTGYQIEAPIYVTRTFATGVGGTGSSQTIGQTITSWNVSVTDAAAGTIVLGLTESQTGLLSTSSSYRWFLRWVDTASQTRTVLSGSVVARNP